MATLREYDIKPDSKKRITLRSVHFEKDHVKEYSDGRIVLKPRELVSPFQASSNTLSMMDRSVKNMKEGYVSEKIDLSELKD